MRSLIARLKVCLVVGCLVIPGSALSDPSAAHLVAPAVGPSPTQLSVAATSESERACRWGSTAEARIEACTTMLGSGQDNRVRAMALDQRGNAWSDMRDYERAVSDFDEANRLWPEFGGPYVDRATVRMEKGDHQAAITDYDALVRLFPGDPFGLAGRCWARALAGEHLEKALTDCNRAIQMSPWEATYYEDRAIVWLRRGQFSHAISDTDYALSLNPKSARALYVRGLARRAAGQAAQGNTDISAARDADMAAINFLAKWGLLP